VFSFYFEECQTYREAERIVQRTLIHSQLDSPTIITKFISFCSFSGPTENKLQALWHFIPKYFGTYILKIMTFI
jgi:hypothetical protein